MNYTISPEQASQSQNTFLSLEGTTYSSDPTKGHPLESLLKDFQRNVHIAGGNEVDGSRKKALELSEDDFKKFLAQHFSQDNIELLNKHYSQGPQLFTAAPLATASIGCDFIIKQPETADRKVNIYQNNAGELCIDLSVEKYPIVDIRGDDNSIGYIDGPLHCQFKMTEKGFALSSFETESKLIKDLFLDDPLKTEPEALKKLIENEIKLHECRAALQECIQACDEYKNEKINQITALLDEKSELRDELANYLKFSENNSEKSQSMEGSIEGKEGVQIEGYVENIAPEGQQGSINLMQEGISNKDLAISVYKRLDASDIRFSKTFNNMELARLVDQARVASRLIKSNDHPKRGEEIKALTQLKTEYKQVKSLLSATNDNLAEKFIKTIGKALEKVARFITAGQLSASSLFAPKKEVQTLKRSIKQVDAALDAAEPPAKKPKA